MLLDARREDGRTFEADLCIVGAGAAGITMARELAGNGLRIVVLESGGMDFDAATQDLAAGTLTGPIERPHYLVRSRMRGFGGTTNVWTGTCRPLDPIDFVERPWVPHSGWPISRTELEPYYRRSAEILEIPAFDRESVDGQLYPHEDFDAGFDESGPQLVPKVLYGSPPTRFAERYGPEILAADDVEVVLWANAVRVGRSREGEGIEQVDAATLSGSRLSVRARGYVLATGGIENARLLLDSNDVEENGVGNHWGNVGRYFMDHPHLEFAGHAIWSRPDRRAKVVRRFLELIEKRGYPFYYVLSPTDSLQRREKILNGGTRLYPADLSRYRQTGEAELLRQVSQWAREFDAGGHLLGQGRLELDNPHALSPLKFYLECAPNPESRVRLVEERDVLGSRRARVDWRPSGLELPSVRRHLELFAREMGRAGLGRVQIVLDEESAFARQGVLHNHHMGATRMHPDPKKGVVDADCRLHGAANLWIAGSSVFPTAGFANPTMTLVALSLRLCDHLRRELGA